jgi:hydroxyacylglutathione hydrolase
VLLEQIPVLSDNYVYLIHESATGATAAIDPPNAAPVLELLRRKGWRLTHILNTHHHHDHTGGNLDLKRATGCTIVGGRSDAARIPGIDLQVGDGDSVRIGNAEGVVFETPGHTSGHVAYWFAESLLLFCGDTLFSLGCGRLFEGTAQQMWASLSRLRALPAEAKVCCAHDYTLANGRFARLVERDNPAMLAVVDQASRQVAAGRPTVPSTMGEERAANPFLRADVPAIARAVGLEPGSDPATVFAELRRRKDVF